MMKIIFITHPSFLDSQSMPRYANWLINGMKKKGHYTEHWQPKSFFFRLPVPKVLKKWMGYLDQYILFPQEIKRKIKSLSGNFLFVLTDHALGPWVPLIANKPHVIHCHDFLAQMSALGEISENPTGLTGRYYQTFIRKGYTKGNNFISISEATQNDLHKLLKKSPLISEIIYNGLLDEFTKADNILSVRNQLMNEFSINLQNGYLLHVGGNQWYKNRKGVINIYNAWRTNSSTELPLLMVGTFPSKSLQTECNKSPFRNSIHFLTDISDKVVKRLYSGASIFLFPSLAEGFGWPIIEAMASGCPVITTNMQPMSEVAGDAALLIPRCPNDELRINDWAIESANSIDNILNLSATDLNKFIASGFANVERFDSIEQLQKIENIYKTIMTI